MSLALLDLAVESLGDELLEEVVFVGAATLALWITDEAAPPLRPTADVDVVVEIATRMDYTAFEQRLRSRGFRDDGHVICRWHHPKTGLILDAMPTDATILGFENRWQSETVAHATRVTLSSDAGIRCAPPAYLLATKFEAFRSRGKGDLLGSKDFQDIASLLDGRPSLLDEIISSPSPVQKYLAAQARDLLAHPHLRDGLEAAMPLGHASQARARLVVEPLVHRLAELNGA